MIVKRAAQQLNRKFPLRFFSTDKRIIEQQEELLFPRTVQTIKQTANPPDSSSSQPAQASDTPVQTPELSSASLAPEKKDEEVAIDDWDQTLMTPEELQAHGETWRKKHGFPAEQGFGYRGNEPTMFGDWQHKGRTTDF